MIRTVPDLNGVDRVYVPGSPLPVVEHAFDVAPPDAGADTEAILAELGLSAPGGADG